MRHHLLASAAVIAATAIFASSPALAQKWHTANQARKSALVVECGRNQEIWLKIELPSNSGWQANVPVSARVGGQTFALEISGGGDYILLSDTSTLGISPALMAALQTAPSFVLEGPAVRGASVAGRTYSLKGAAAQLGRIAQACGMDAAAQPDAVLTASPSGQGGATTAQAAAPRLPGVADARKVLEDSCTVRITY